jgi:hypothetical protein
MAASKKNRLQLWERVHTERLDRPRPPVGASRTMIERTAACFGIKPEWLVGDTAYGSAPNLERLVNEQKIAPHIPVIDKSKREDGTFSRDDFSFDKERDIYICPEGDRKVVTDDQFLCARRGNGP